MRPNGEGLAKLAEEYEGGETVRTLATRYGVHHSTMWAWLNLAGAKMRPTYKPMPRLDTRVPTRRVPSNPRHRFDLNDTGEL